MTPKTSDLDPFIAGKAKETFQYYWASTKSSSTLTGLESMEAKIDALEKCRAAVMKAFDLEAIELRRMRNAMAPFHRLPMETFIAILLQVVEDHDETSADETVQLHNLARVCSHWQSVLLNYPEFWKALSPRFGAYFRRWTLERNRKGPLRIYYVPWSSMRREPRIEFLESVVNEAGRWQKLVFQDELDEHICALLRHEMPRLTDIFINNTMRHSPIPPPELFLSDGATLRYLSLTNATVAWHSARIKNLRALELGHITECLPSLHQLHAILSSSPQLWCLMLLDLTKESALDGEAPQGEIYLPCLTTLAIQNVPDSITRMVLSTITAPACNFVVLSNLQPQYVRNFPSKLEALLRPLLQNRPSMGCNATTALPDSASITLFSIPVHDIPSGWLYHITEPAGVDVKFEFSNFNEGDLRDVVKWIGSLVPVDQVPEELVLALDGCDLPERFIFGRSGLGQIAAKRLRLLSLETINKVLQWLNDCPIQTGGGGKRENDEGPYFPFLDAIYLDCSHSIEPTFPALLKFIESRVGLVGEPDCTPSQLARPPSSNNVKARLSIGAPELWVNEVKECFDGHPVDVVQILDPMRGEFEY